MRVGTALLSLVLPVATSAYPLNGSADNHQLAKCGAKEVESHKQFSNSRWTFYDVGLGACGKVNVPSDFVVALNSAQYGQGFPGPNCFKKITMTYKGKTATAVIVDKCPGCPVGGLDLSVGLFEFFAPESEGVIFGEWNFSA
ncbi:hypothetical protein E4T56_gene3384 [Termitomyces sp. T112]|nr:hypothetical protein C0989_010111 [Termitomyces sp. Mn162]KAG5716869.1 hypothetical protein E4T56_gene3384 [Termitomyces sp. T112]KAH0582313.1 hypothetical protein H2248_010256 [Termitomyces sp. 'cryptogamus']